MTPHKLELGPATRPDIQVHADAAGHMVVNTMLGYRPDQGIPYVMGDGAKPAPDERAVFDRWQNQAAAKREQVLALPTSNEGIDIDRANNYARLIKTPDMPLLFLAPAEYAEYARRDGGPIGHTEEQGTYAPDLGLVVVKRSPELEELNGPELAESFAIHERVHSKSKPIARVSFSRDSKGRINKAHTLQEYGFAISMPDGRHAGEMLEEGRAEFERGQYVEKVLGRSRGFATEGGRPTDEYSKYLWVKRAEGGKLVNTHAQGMFGALVFEMLIKKDESLLPLLRQEDLPVDAIRDMYMTSPSARSIKK